MDIAKITANNFMKDVLVFINRNGKVEHKSSTPMSSNLSMSYDVNKIKAKFDVYTHGMGNGSCSVTVYFNNRKVYVAEGCFMGTPFAVEEKIYKPGKWEELMSVKRVTKAA